MTDQQQPRRGGFMNLALDTGVLLGAGLFVFGLYQVWHPLAPIVGGLLLAVCCLFAGYDRLRRGEK